MIKLVEALRKYVAQKNAASGKHSNTVVNTTRTSCEAGYRPYKDVICCKSSLLNISTSVTTA
jgi:hypothetical protein